MVNNKHSNAIFASKPPDILYIKIQAHQIELKKDFFFLSKQIVKEKKTITTAVRTWNTCHIQHLQLKLSTYMNAINPWLVTIEGEGIGIAPSTSRTL